MVKFIDLEHLVSEKTEDDRPVRPKSKPGEMATHFRQMETDPDLDLPDLAVAVTDKNDLYTEGLRYVTQVFAAIRKRKKFALDPGFRIIRRIVQSRSTQRSLFIKAIHQDDTRAYLAQKSVNVSLFSIRMADMLGYDSDQQVEIGMAGLLREIGMALIPEKVLFKGGPLSGQELEVVRQHSEFGYQILKIYSSQYPYLAEVALQVHERIDGSGYPRGLRGDEIHEYAQIIGLVDTYEALSHSRPYRGRFHHFYAIKEIIRTSKVCFQRKHLKALLNTVSIFPLSTLVRLNFNAIGRVIQTFPDCPMRPRLRIEFDSQGRRVLTDRIVHLPDNPLLYIVDSVSEDDIHMVGRDTAEVVGSRVESPEVTPDPSAEGSPETPGEARGKAETPNMPSPEGTPRKRSGWLRRALGLGLLVLISAVGFWQWYRPGETATTHGGASGSIQDQTPFRMPVVQVPKPVPAGQSDIVPLVHKVSTASVATSERPAPANTRHARPVPPVIQTPAADELATASEAQAEGPGPVLTENHPVPVSAPTEYPYPVLLGSFRMLDSAENALAEYRTKGYTVYRVTVNLDKGGVWHRLFAGFFKNSKDAEAFIAGHQLEGALAKRTRFAASLGAFRSESLVTKMLPPLHRKGYSPYIIEDTAHGYRLMVGAFYTEAGAAQQVAELAKDGFSGKVVAR